MTLEVTLDYYLMFDVDELKDEFNNDIHEYAKFLYDEFGVWWNTDKMELVKTEIE